MHPKEFIISNSNFYQKAVDNGYDITMDENEIFNWMVKYADFMNKKIK